MNLKDEGYWDNYFDEEIRNFRQHGDEGHVWFGTPLTSRIADRIVKTIENGLRDGKYKSDINILEVGCGNAGLLLTVLEKAQERLDDETLARLYLHGIDYSANAITLSEEIINSKNLNHRIVLRQCNFVDLEEVTALASELKFDFIVDKGTLDAIGLLAGPDCTKVHDTYRASLEAISHPGTIYTLASCNHSHEELQTIFVRADGFQELGRIETPKFTFGGQEGSTTTCVIFDLKDKQE